MLSGNQAAELTALLAEFGEQPSGGDPAMTRARLFETLLALFEALAEERPLVLVVEDAHWADRSTGDLLTFLVRNLRQAPVLLIITFRPEDTERAPIRSLAAGLGRMEGVWRTELKRLSRRDVAAQLVGILSGPPNPPHVNAIYQRGGGNPLFTEALVNQDGSLVTGLPGSLRDLILAGVKELPAETEQVLRMTAVGGDHVAHALLAAAANLDDVTLTSALRPAVAARILISDVDGYGFRHQLFREAVLADLLPGERAVAHRGFAVAIDATPPARRGSATAVQLALHWRGAHEDERALTAAWQAAADAGAAFGYEQRLQMLDQVRELWASVPDAVSSTGTDYVGVLELAADPLVGRVNRSVPSASWPRPSPSLARRRSQERRAAVYSPGTALVCCSRSCSRLASSVTCARHCPAAGSASTTAVRARIIAQYSWALPACGTKRSRRTIRPGAVRPSRASRRRGASGGLKLRCCSPRLPRTRAKTRSPRSWARRDHQLARLGSGHLEAWAYLTLQGMASEAGQQCRSRTAWPSRPCPGQAAWPRPADSRADRRGASRRAQACRQALGQRHWRYSTRSSASASRR